MITKKFIFNILLFCQSPVLHSDPSQKPEIGYAILHRPNLVLAFNTVSRQTAVTQHSDSIRCPQATAARAAARPAGQSSTGPPTSLQVTTRSYTECC